MFDSRVYYNIDTEKIIVLQEVRRIKRELDVKFSDQVYKGIQLLMLYC